MQVILSETYSGTSSVAGSVRITVAISAPIEVSDETDMMRRYTCELAVQTQIGSTRKRVDKSTYAAPTALRALGQALLRVDSRLGALVDVYCLQIEMSGIPYDAQLHGAVPRHEFEKMEQMREEARQGLEQSARLAAKLGAIVDRGAGR